MSNLKSGCRGPGLWSRCCPGLVASASSAAAAAAAAAAAEDAVFRNTAAELSSYVSSIYASQPLKERRRPSSDCDALDGL